MSTLSPADEAPIVPPKRANVTLIVVFVLGGLALGCLVLMIFGAAILLPVIRQGRRAAQRTTAMTQMRELALANLLYASDSDGRLPVAGSWMDAVSPKLPSNRALYSPGIARGILGVRKGYGVAFMKSLSSAQLSTISDPAQRVIVFDSTLMERNAASGLETVPKPPRFGSADNGGNVFGFLDGHAKLVTAIDEVNLK